MRLAWKSLALVAVATALLVQAQGAAAAASPFGCRASLARISSGGPGGLEPVVANPPGSPCMTDSSGVSTISLPSGGSPSVIAGPGGAFTFSSTSQPTTTGAVAPGASALASVDGVTIPTSNGLIVVVGPIEARASYACDNGQLVSHGSTSLDLLEINGTPVPLASGQQTIPLGGGSYITANEEIKTPTSLTERALDVHFQGGGEIILGEALVTLNTADPCAGTQTQTPPAVNPCPDGSTYVPSAQACEIIVPGEQTIFISQPYGGPTGGTVLSITVARKRYHSPCLYGPGPNYVIVGTNGPDRINGTARSERILGLGGADRIAGQAGDDCIDGGSGNDRIYGGNGNERIYGGPGDDRISVQNGDSLIYGDSGNNQIFVGDGNNVIYGGPGNNRISVGRGSNRIFGGAGKDDISTADGNNYISGGRRGGRIWVGNGLDSIWAWSGFTRIYAPGERDAVHCGSRQADLVYLNFFATRYARRHGCTRVRAIRPRQL
jgi:hemolysin type calcium-binding protein